MRYQRRGINEAGDVANFVETEEIVLFERDDETHTASFVQTRGSSTYLKHCRTALCRLHIMTSFPS